MCYQEFPNEPLTMNSFFDEVPAPSFGCRPASFKGFSTPWIAYQPPKSTPVQPITCSNCKKLRRVLLFIAAVAIFSPILISMKSPLQMSAQPAIELTTHVLVYSAACFPVASMAVSYDILRKQPCRSMCAFCCLHAATSIALRGLSYLHSAVLPAPKTAGTIEFWSNCVHSVLLRPALWITGGDLDDFPFSKDPRVQVWMLCMLCSAMLGLVVGFGLGSRTATTHSFSAATTVTTAAVEKVVEKSVEETPSEVINPLDDFLSKYEVKLIKIHAKDGVEKTVPTVPPTLLPVEEKSDQCPVRHRSLSTVEAGFISACSLSGFWLCLTVIGTFATAV